MRLAVIGDDAGGKSADRRRQRSGTGEPAKLNFRASAKRGAVEEILV
jgi:hypothetical protein